MNPCELTNVVVSSFRPSTSNAITLSVNTMLGKEHSNYTLFATLPKKANVAIVLIEETFIPPIKSGSLFEHEATALYIKAKYQLQHPPQSFKRAWGNAIYLLDQNLKSQQHVFPSLCHHAPVKAVSNLEWNHRFVMASSMLAETSPLISFIGEQCRPLYEVINAS